MNMFSTVIGKIRKTSDARRACISRLNTGAGPASIFHDDSAEGAVHARRVWPNLEAAGAKDSWGGGTWKAHNIPMI